MEVCVDSVESAVNAERGGKGNYTMHGGWQPFLESENESYELTSKALAKLGGTGGGLQQKGHHEVHLSY